MLAYITEKLLNNLSLKYLLLVYEIIAEKHGCRERLYIILTFFFFHTEVNDLSWRPQLSSEEHVSSRSQTVGFGRVVWEEKRGRGILWDGGMLASESDTVY